jgi:hypothetical protein
MHIVALNMDLILVNIILELAVLGTMAVLINRNARRLRVVQQQLVAQSDLVDGMIRAMSQAQYESTLSQLRESEAVLSALKTRGGIVH